MSGSGSAWIGFGSIRFGVGLVRVRFETGSVGVDSNSVRLRFGPTPAAPVRFAVGSVRALLI